MTRAQSPSPLAQRRVLKVKHLVADYGLGEASPVTRSVALLSAERLSFAFAFILSNGPCVHGNICLRPGFDSLLAEKPKSIIAIDNYFT